MYKKKSRLDIKKQLLAAICMLLISSLMMVTSTYAWFTLSTAPEVKGIQTSVGANGNLEIALLSTAASLDGTGITSNVGDSSAAAGKSALTANITWGNLVDLSHESYGLNMIKLLPAALDNGGTAGYISHNFLAVPTYGADGRVNELSAEGTQSGLYDTTKQAFIVPASTTATDTVFGMRGVGVSTNQSVRDMAYNSAMSAASSAAIKFKQAATTSLAANGGALVALGAKSSANSTVLSANEVAVIQKIIDDILADGGIAQVGDEMLASYVAATFASDLNRPDPAYASDEEFTVALEALAPGSNDWVRLVEANAFLKNLQTALTNLRSNATAAQTAMENAGKDSSYTWGEVENAVTQLFNNLDIWGYKINELKDMEKPTLLQILTDNGGKIIANIKGGVYAEMASIGGGFSQQIQVDFNAILPEAELGNMPVLLNAVGTTPSNSAACAAALTGKKYVPAEGEVTATTTSISDTYGYIVDLAFRTNASGSNLLLQTTPEKRVNTTGGAETGAVDPVMGGGSSITFASIQPGFTAEKMLALMEHMRFVFFTPNSTTDVQPILGYAKLDTAGAENASGYNKDAMSVTVDLYMCKSTTTTTDNVTTTTWDLTQVDKENAVIRPLNANVATPVSLLVYLDGNTIQNGDVAAGALSMTGTLNIQFASSAELVPMNYTAGYGSANDPTEYTVTINNQSTGFAINAANSVLAGKDYTFTVNGNGTPTVTAMIGENPVTLTKATGSNTYTIEAADITGNITITVAGTATESTPESDPVEGA